LSKIHNMLSKLHSIPPKALILLGFILVALVVSMGSARPGLSHPHVFLESEMRVELDRDGIKGLWHEWIFDEYQSAWIISQYAKDGSGEISGPELDRLYRETFDNLKAYDFFTWVVVGDETIAAGEIDHFSVKIRDNLAVYSFFIPLDISLGQNPEEVYILVYDETYFCHIFFPPEEVGFTGETWAWNIEYSFTKRPDMSFYFGMVTPEAVKLKLSPL